MTRMTPEERDKQRQEIWQGLYGIPGTDDKGFLGDFKELVQHVKKQNGRIRKVEVGLASLISLLAGLGVLDATVIHAVIGS